MPTFKYRVKDIDSKTRQGTIDAKDYASCITALRKEGFTLVTLKEVSKKTGVTKKGRVKPDDLVIFSRQLATLVEAGIPMVSSLATLSEQVTSKEFKEVILRIRSDVEVGFSLSEAIAKYPKLFSGLFINMVQAGETSGTLDEILDRMATYLEKANILSRKVRSALIYPAIVTSMALLITSVMILKVIPSFAEIFQTLKAELPAPTMMLINFSNIIKHYFIFVVGAIVLVVTLLKRYINTPNGALNFDRVKLRLPVFGSLFLKVALARFTSTLALLIKSDVPILLSVDIVARTCGNKVMEKALSSAGEDIKAGETIANALNKYKIFPSLIVRMVQAGEKSGQLDKMLAKSSNFYDEQVDATVSGLSSLIEPLIIVFLGVVIGGIVIAMFLPIFQISKLVGG